MSGVTCYYHPMKVYTIGRCQALQVNSALGNDKRSYDVERGIPAWPLGGTHGWTMSGMGCHHRLCTTYMVGRDRSCYAIIAIGKHKRSDDVECDIPYLPFDSTHDGTTLVRYGIIALGQHILLENIR